MMTAVRLHRRFGGVRDFFLLLGRIVYNSGQEGFVKPALSRRLNLVVCSFDEIVVKKALPLFAGRLF